MFEQQDKDANQDLFAMLPSEISLQITLTPWDDKPHPYYSLPFDALYTLLTEHKEKVMEMKSINPIVEMIITNQGALDEQLELIEISSEIIEQGIREKKITPNKIIEYYLYRGDFFWKQNVFSTAIASYQKAINTMLIFNEVQGEKDLLVPLKIGDYWYQHLNYPKAVKAYQIGIELSGIANNQAITNKYQERMIQALKTTVQVYVFASIAYHWENKHDDARLSLIQGIIYLSEALETQLSLLQEEPFKVLLQYLISSYSQFRHLSESDYEILEALRSLVKTKSEETMKRIVTTLKRYCESEYKPLIYGILVTTDTGIEIYSKFEEEPDKLFSEFIEPNSEKEVSITEASTLYSSLFSALGISLRKAFKRPRDIKQIKHGEITILVEKGSYVLSFLFADKETFELRQKLKSLVYKIEHTFSAELEIFTGEMLNEKELEKIVNETLY